MPILVPCEELQPGMKLFEPIVSGGRIMLQSGRPLTRGDITVLRRRYPALSVRIGDPVLDDVVEFEDDEEERKVAQEAQQRVAHTMSEVRERFERRAAIGAAQCERIYQAVNDIVSYLTAHPKTAALLTHCLEPDTYLGTHTGNVFYLSMLLGSAVREYVVSERRRQTKASVLRKDVAMDLTPLGLGAFFMDVALLSRAELFTEETPFDDQARTTLENHPNESADMLPEVLPAAAKMIVRTHHETFDASGYPFGMPPEKQHVFTRIVRIADAYDSAISKRVFKQGRSPVRALCEMLIGAYRHFYDPSLMKAFARLVQPFPIGSKLRLEDGRYGVVVRYNRTNPFRPIVMVSFDAHDKPLPREAMEGPVTAGDKPHLRIRSFGGEDLSFLYEPQQDHPNIPRRLPFKTLFDAFYP